MRRRVFLAGITGVTASFAGCGTSGFTSNPPGEVYNPIGHAAIRPIDEPYLQHGLTSKSEQYLYARLFRRGDSLAVTDNPDASEFSRTVDELSGDQFAILTNLRTAAAVSAYFWPTDTRWSNGRLSIELERRTQSSTVGGEEAVGVALTTYEVDGELPGGADIVFPGGAVISVGTRD